MPIVQRGAPDPFSMATGALPDPSTQPQPTSPGFGSTLAAAWRQSNVIGSGVSWLHNFSDVDNHPDPGYSAWNEIKGTPYEDHWASFANSNNSRWTAALKRQVDQETQDRKTIASAGWGGTLASLGAGIIDPTILIPVGGEITGGKGLYTLGKAALRGAEAGGVSIALQEGGLQATQQERTGEESAINIGGGILLGGLLGAGAHALLSRGERKTALDAFDTLLPGNDAQPGSIGAAAVTGLTKEDLTVAGAGTNAVAKTTQFISPNMRLNQSPSAIARQVGQDLAEGTMYQTMHEEGRSAGAAVETLARVNYRARLAAAVEAHGDIYKEMKQSGFNISRGEFEDRVGQAMRAEDKDPENDFISRAAKSWRETLVNPYFNDAKAAGVLEDGDATKFAASYFPRQYNTKVLVANEAQIKAEWAQFMEGKVQADYASSAETLRNTLAQHDTVLGDLSLPPKKRAARITDLEAQGASLDVANPQHVDRISSVNDLRTKAKQAATDNNHVEADRLREEARQAYAEGGPELARYLKERRSLRARHARLSDSPATKAARDTRIEAVTAKKRAAERAFYDRWEIKRAGEGVDPHDPSVVPSFKSLASDAVDDVYDKLTGRNYGDGTSVEPEYMTPIARGPIRERTLPIPDEMLNRQGVLHNNVVEVLHRYARVMGADTELTAKFGDPRMTDQFTALRDQYRQMREAVADKPKELAKLTKREEQDVNDLRSIRDLLRGTYKARENASTFARVVRAAGHLNYVRSMGGVIPASLSDLYRPAMVHGLKSYMGDGIAPLLKNMEAVKLSVKEAKLAGQITETVLQQRMVSLGEIADPMSRGNPVERFLENSSKVASKLNGIQYWTDGIKSITAIMSQNRILNGEAGERTLAFLGLDKDMAARVQKQFADFGEVRDGVHIANTEKWTDPLAVKNFRAAVSKDIDSIIVTPGVGDVPLFSHTPLGKLLLQFRSFMFASHQRVLLRGMQEGKAGFVGSMVGMTALGMLATVLKAWRGGHDRFEKFKDAAENPGYLIGEGLDNSGMFTLPFDIANTTEKLSTSAGFKFNPIKNPMMAAGTLVRPGASQEGESIRFSSRGPLGTLLGPTAGMVEQGFTAAQGAPALVKGQPVSKASRNAAIGLLPFNSYLGMREAVQALNGDSPYAE